MSKVTRKTPHAPAREQSVTIRLSAQEYQLIAYAAARSNARGVNAWMRTKLVEAARERLSEKVAAEILEGKATATLLKESLAASTKKTRRKGGVLSFEEGKTRR